MNHFDYRPSDNEDLRVRFEQWLTRQERRYQYVRMVLIALAVVATYGILLSSLRAITHASWWAVAINSGVTTVCLAATVQSELRHRKNRGQ